MNVLDHKTTWLVASGTLVGASILALIFWGLRLGIDFTGGSLIEIEFASNRRPAPDQVRDALAPLGIGGIAVQPVGERGIFIRSAPLDEKMHQEILRRLNDLAAQKDPASGDAAGVVERRFDAIGPALGSELKRKALIAVGIASGAIILYIAFAFRGVSDPVPSWVYGVMAVAALLHDVMIPTGVLSILGRFRGVEVDALFVTAVLTIMGFSVHDTIVAFDRIRENLKRKTAKENFVSIVNRSVAETMARSIRTSAAVLLVLGAVFLFGGQTTRLFSLILIIGITVGTYSSIFVASPLLVVWNEWRGT